MDHCTNLLPPERSRLVQRSYFLRLGVVASILGIVLVVVAAVLLLPSYLYLAQAEQVKQEHLASVKAALARLNESQLVARLGSLTKDTAAIDALGKAPSVSGVVRDALGVSRQGITIANLSYVPPRGKTLATLTIAGTAKTREALHAYQAALQSAPFAASADLPVSAYAQATDIPFTITVTLSP